LEKELTFPCFEVAADIEATLQRVVTGLGMDMVGPDGQCDATLTVVLSGSALRAHYIGLGTCYTGAEVHGEIRLAAPGKDPISVPVSDTDEPPEYTSSCPAKLCDAPFLDAWGMTLLRGLGQLWDIPADELSPFLP
jgi:hypothetical protein